MSSNNPFISGNEEEIEGILAGAIDTHVHAGPDPYIERKLDAYQLAEDSIAAGMAGIVLKSHDYPTQSLASLITNDSKYMEDLHLTSQLADSIHEL